MNLEQRVQQLEQEVQVLKSQIQATLLDIQELLLTQAHPTLRANEPAPLKVTPAAVHTEVEEPDMEAWVKEKVETVGAARTRKLIQSDMFEDHEQKTMLALVDLYTNSTARNVEPIPLHEPLKKKSKDSGSPHKTILRLIAGVQNIGVGHG